MDWDELSGLFPEFPGAERWLPLLRRHAELIAEQAPRVRVSSVAPEDLVRRQYAESLEMWAITARTIDVTGSPTVVDVGSGGGFPGMVIAALAPALEVHLVEPLQKRARLLDEVAKALGLAKVTVHAQRAEEAGRGPLRDSADIVTARAVAELRELLEYTAPVAKPGAMIVLAKGSRADEEVAGAGTAMAALGCELVSRERMRPAISEQVSLLFLRKLGETPAAYPRRPGMVAKRPL